MEFKLVKEKLRGKARPAAEVKMRKHRHKGLRPRLRFRLRLPKAN